jgi:molybdenum-dependent DNA-binding transcriptional regulator ModE
MAPTSPTAARQMRERAAALLTRDFFEREYQQTGCTLRAIAATTEITYKLVAQHVRANGFPVSNRSKKQDAVRARRAATAKKRRTVAPRKAKASNRQQLIDPDWLREQAGTLQRANTDIGAKLGLSRETVRRHRKHLGIAACLTGSAGHTVHTRRHPDLPADIRRAVEDKRHGWQRLRRLQQIASHHSINATAHALGLHHQSLVLQLVRVESDIGGRLINCANSRYRSMQLTPRGQRLINHLGEPLVRQLLNRYTPAVAK